MAEATWFLMKAADRQVHGPVDFDTIQSWASEAKISPMDKISRDSRKSWVRAPMIDELQMDWLIEMPDNYLYGPTNVATIQEFLATGDIDESVNLINCRDGVESRLADTPFYQASPHHVRSAATTFQGTQYSTQSNSDPALLERLHALEKQLMEYQHAIDQWQQAYESLRQQFVEATGRDPL
jgi:hypothetical protein